MNQVAIKGRMANAKWNYFKYIRFRQMHILLFEMYDLVQNVRTCDNVGPTAPL